MFRRPAYFLLLIILWKQKYWIIASAKDAHRIERYAGEPLAESLAESPSESLAESPYRVLIGPWPSIRCAGEGDYPVARGARESGSILELAKRIHTQTKGILRDPPDLKPLCSFRLLFGSLFFVSANFG